MPSNLVVEKEFLAQEGKWSVSAHIEPGGTLPTHSFLHYNDEGALGDFYAVCTIETLQRPVFTSGMPSFGARFVREDSVTITRNTEEEADSFIVDLRARLTELNTALENTSLNITTYVIGE